MWHLVKPRYALLRLLDPVGKGERCDATTRPRLTAVLSCGPVAQPRPFYLTPGSASGFSI
jgi:hypothetical protein